MLLNKDQIATISSVGDDAEKNARLGRSEPNQCYKFTVDSVCPPNSEEKVLSRKKKVVHTKKVRLMTTLHANSTTLAIAVRKRQVVMVGQCSWCTIYMSLSAHKLPKSQQSRSRLHRQDWNLILFLPALPRLTLMFGRLSYCDLATLLGHYPPAQTDQSSQLQLIVVTISAQCNKKVFNGILTYRVNQTGILICISTIRAGRSILYDIFQP